MANRNKQDDLDQEEHDEQAGDEDDEEERRRRKKAKQKAAAATREDVEDEEEEDEESDDEEEEEDEEGSDDDDDEEDPYWWTPHAVMGTLIAIGFLGFLGVFPKVFGPKKAEGATETKPAAAATTAAIPPASVRMPPKMPIPPPQQQGESIGAQHLLVMHKESPRAPAGITRTKEEAKKRAEEALAKLKKGTDFNALVKEYTDEPGSKDKNPPGDLGMFGKGRMVPPFEQAAFGLKPNETSGIVETQFGFHIIRRLKLEA